MSQIIKGADTTVKLQFLTVAADTRTETELDISNASEIKWVLRTNKTTSTNSLLKTKTGGDIAFITDGVDGWCTFDVPDDESEDLATGTYYWQAKAVIGSKTHYSDIDNISVCPILPGL